jgi:hypothetical protein
MHAAARLEMDRFVVSRRRRYTLTPAFSSVDIYDFAEAASDEPICHVRQPVSRFNADIRFYADEARTAELLRVRAHPRFDPWARHEVTGPAGETIGAIEKTLGGLRSAYVLYGAEGAEVARADARPPGAPVRRVAGHVGIAALAGLLGLGGITFAGPGSLVGLAAFGAAIAGRELRGRVDPVDAVSVFDITRDGEPLGTHCRRPRPQGPGDLLLGSRWAGAVYDIDMSPDRARSVDRRLVLALTVALDALRGVVAESPLR